jgi:hypothetical protein
LKFDEQLHDWLVAGDDARRADFEPLLPLWIALVSLFAKGNMH